METHHLDTYFSGRVSPTYLGQRLDQERNHEGLAFRGGLKIYWENLDLVVPLLRFLLRATGLMKHGMRHTLQYSIEHNFVHLPLLPQAFTGFRILQLSDLHTDGMLDYGQHLVEAIRQCDYDLCVVTGDFRFLTYGQTTECLTHLERIMTVIKKDVPCLGILGNHDSITMVPALERMGIRMLINESFVLKKDGDVLGIAGVDDSHFYRTADLPKAMAGIRTCPAKILLAHSQELIVQASGAGCDLYLSGHTHGGQICLPGGTTIIRNTPHFNRYVKGSWCYHTMQGYTSRGAGTSCLPVRFFCPPEITMHQLHPATA